LDNGYHAEKLTQALETVYPEMMTKIQLGASHFGEYVTKGLKWKSS
jgi:hypothetical protein